MGALAMKAVRLLALLLAIAGFLALLAATFMAYFIFSVDPDTHQVYDGLGRQLEEAPQWARKLLGAEEYWAGLGWRAIDTVAFFGTISLLFAIGGFGVSSSDDAK